MSKAADETNSLTKAASRDVLERYFPDLIKSPIIGLDGPEQYTVRWDVPPTSKQSDLYLMC